MMHTSSTLFVVLHNQFATDRWKLDTTIVEASNEQEAMDKLNNYLKTNPYGVYTPELCKSIDDVYPLEYLK